MRSAFRFPREMCHRALRDVLLFGLFGGLLITLLKLTEYRFPEVEHSVGIYGALVAALFSGLGIWLGVTLVRKKGGTLLSAAILRKKPATAAT